MRLQMITVQRIHNYADSTEEFEIPEGAVIVEAQWFQRDVYITLAIK